METKQNRKPRWIMLNLIGLMAVGGLVFEHSVHLSPTSHKLLLVMMIALIYGLMALWAKSNAPALQELEDQTPYQRSPGPRSGTAHHAHPGNLRNDAA